MGAGTVALQRPPRESRDALGHLCRAHASACADERQSGSTTVMIFDVVAACPSEFRTVIVTVKVRSRE